MTSGLLDITITNIELLRVGLFALIGYLLGSLPTALVISHFKRLNDPRDSGSGNAGATNMMRLHGKALALLTLLGDVLKGYLVIWSYQFWEISQSSDTDHLSDLQHLWLTLIALSVVIGHIYPIFFQFKGGKGVATILGVMLASSLGMALFTLFCWISALLITRVSAYAALSAAFISPAVAWYIDEPYLGLWLSCSLVLFVSHRENIQHLIRSKIKTGS